MNGLHDVVGLSDQLVAGMRGMDGVADGTSDGVVKFDPDVDGTIEGSKDALFVWNADGTVEDVSYVALMSVGNSVLASKLVNVCRHRSGFGSFG